MNVLLGVLIALFPLTAVGAGVYLIWDAVRLWKIDDDHDMRPLFVFQGWLGFAVGLTGVVFSIFCIFGGI